MSAARPLSFDVPTRSASESTAFAIEVDRRQLRLVVHEHDAPASTSIEVATSAAETASTMVHFAAPGYRFRFSIPVVVTRSEDGFIVSDSLVQRYGEGETIDAALEDFRDVLLDYFETLREHRGHLSRRTRRHLVALEFLITSEQ